MQAGVMDLGSLMSTLWTGIGMRLYFIHDGSLLAEIGRPLPGRLSLAVDR